MTAKQAGLSVAYVWYIEDGQRPRVGLRALRAIARVLDVDVMTLTSATACPCCERPFEGT